MPIPPSRNSGQTGDLPPFDLLAVLDTLHEGCELIGFDYTCLYVNAAAAAQRRRSRSEMLGRKLSEVDPEFEQTPMFGALSACMADRLHRVVEEQFTAADGTTGCLELHLNPVAQGTFVVSCDILDRKTATEDRRQLATAIHQAAESVVIADLTGAIQYVNPAFERITGYSRQEVLGRNPSILKSGRQDAGYYREMWAALRGGQAWRGRFVNRRKDGSEYTQDSSVTPVLDDQGVVISFVGVGRDVTTELRLEADLLQAQKMETIGRLAGGVAHDFNNLLSVIIAYADVAMTDLPDTAPLRSDLVHIREAGDRAASLTRQLLAFSRQQVLEPEILDLNRVVQQMGDILQRLVGEDVQLTLTLAAGLGHVRVDPRQLEQVVLNLTVNSHDSMPDGGQFGISTSEVVLDEVYTSQHVDVTPGRYVLLAVTDTGSGMSEGTRQRIFDPFFTTKPAGKGTGLGLATVYGIVKQSGGHIWVYSEEGHGTTFKIYLPCYEGEETLHVEPIARGAVGGSGETVLLVEDEEAVRRVAERILTTAGYRMLTAANGAEALAVLEQHGNAIHLLLTDVVMPVMNGKELAEEVVRRCPGARVLFMSGYSGDAVVDHGVLAPDVVFLEKPFNVLDLQLKVHEVLSRP